MAVGVHVFQLRARPKSLCPHGTNRDIGIAPKAPFFHLSVTDLEVLEDATQRPEIGSGFLSGSYVGGADNLDQGNPRTVEVHITKLARLH